MRVNFVYIVCYRRMFIFIFIFKLLKVEHITHTDSIFF